jgi:enoyl-CoA hydratase
MLTFTTDNKTAIIGLDDGKANAVDKEFAATLNHGLDQAERAETGAVVIHGRPGVLCAGFNFAVFKKPREEPMALVGRVSQTLDRIYLSPQPVVIACQGHAFTIGAFMLLAGDVRIGAAGEFQIGFNETSMDMTLPP